jgi:DNA-binding XRE family transcriptional regulator
LTNPIKWFLLHCGIVFLFKLYKTGGIVMSEQVRQIAVRIRELREISGIPIEELAKELDISLETYREYESGEVRADGMELTDARFWNIDQLPAIPTEESIAGRMIRRIVDMIQSGKKAGQ